LARNCTKKVPATRPATTTTPTLTATATITAPVVSEAIHAASATEAGEGWTVVTRKGGKPSYAAKPPVEAIPKPFPRKTLFISVPLKRTSQEQKT